jgi:hypothetical protein
MSPGKSDRAVRVAVWDAAASTGGRLRRLVRTVEGARSTRHGQTWAQRSPSPAVVALRQQ